MRKNLKKIRVSFGWVLVIFAVIIMFVSGIQICKIQNNPVKHVKKLLYKANSAADAEIAKDNLEQALNLLQKLEWDAEKESAVFELEEYLITSIENYQVLIDGAKNESYFQAFKALQDTSSKFKISNILLNENAIVFWIIGDLLVLIILVVLWVASIEEGWKFHIVIPVVRKKEEKQIS